MLHEVTAPIERRLSSVPGITSIESETTDGEARIVVGSAWQTDPDRLRIDVARRIEGARLSSTRSRSRHRHERIAGDRSRRHRRERRGTHARRRACAVAGARTHRRRGTNRSGSARRRCGRSCSRAPPISPRAGSPPLTSKRVCVPSGVRWRPAAYATARQCGRSSSRSRSVRSRSCAACSFPASLSARWPTSVSARSATTRSSGRPAAMRFPPRVSSSASIEHLRQCRRTREGRPQPRRRPRRARARSEDLRRRRSQPRSHPRPRRARACRARSASSSARSCSASCSAHWRPTLALSVVIPVALLASFTRLLRRGHSARRDLARRPRARDRSPRRQLDRRSRIDRERARGRTAAMPSPPGRNRSCSRSWRARSR